MGAPIPGMARGLTPSLVEPVDEVDTEVLPGCVDVGGTLPSLSFDEEVVRESFVLARPKPILALLATVDVETAGEV